MERIKQAIEKVKQNQPTQQAQAATEQVSKIETQVATSAAPASPHSLENIVYTQTRVIEMDPAHLENNRIITHNKNNLLGQSFDLLRTQVSHVMSENGWRTLAITSPTAEAGKSVVSINLAMSIAQQKEKTAMLVDFDLRRPKIAKYLGLDLDKSLNEVLAGQAEVADALINPGIPRLVVLPTKKPVPHSSEVLTSRKVDKLIHDLRDRYDERIVIFDLPPLLNVDDSIAVLPKIDCVIMVVGNGMSTKQEIEDSLQYLPSTNLLGVVLNKSERDGKAYYYY